MARIGFAMLAIACILSWIAERDSHSQHSFLGGSCMTGLGAAYLLANLAIFAAGALLIVAGTIRWLILKYR